MPQRLKLNDLNPQGWVQHCQSLRHHIVSKRPNNWRDYIREMIEEAKCTGATEIEEIGCGHEGIAFALYKHGAPMWVVLRGQCGSQPKPIINGLLPFYRDEVVQFAGDPEPRGEISEPQRMVTPPQGAKAQSYIYSRGMRITTMPQIICAESVVNEMGIPFDGITDEHIEADGNLYTQMQQFVASQGVCSLDDHSGNRGFYRLHDGRHIPVLFDPGPNATLTPPEAVTIGSAEDRTRTGKWLALSCEGKADWMDSGLWYRFRKEIHDDAEKLYNGVKTHYCERMEKVPQHELSGDYVMAQLQEKKHKVAAMA